jgi:hypothetical protein
LSTAEVPHDTPELREQLLKMAREWMEAALGEEGGDQELASLH